MGTRLNEPAFTQLIEEDIAILERFIPREYSLEKGHIREILLESIKFYYPPRKKRGWRSLF